MLESEGEGKESTFFFKKTIASAGFVFCYIIIE